jgi:hypothetical protein
LLGLRSRLIDKNEPNESGQQKIERPEKQKKYIPAVTPAQGCDVGKWPNIGTKRSD